MYGMVWYAMVWHCICIVLNVMYCIVMYCNVMYVRAHVRMYVYACIGMHKQTPDFLLSG